MHWGEPIIIDIPYSDKFLRRIIFADWHRALKSKLSGILEYRVLMLMDPWSAKIISSKFLKTLIAKIVRLEQLVLYGRNEVL